MANSRTTLGKSNSKKKNIPNDRISKGTKSASVLYPLDLVYSRAGVSMPKVKVVSPNKIPLPYRSLLVHDNDMTLTLEKHYGGHIVLRPLSTFWTGKSYFRRVLLVQKESGQPVEMGAIRIRLDAFNKHLKEQILGNQIPLGHILRDGRFDYVSRPKAFLAITPNQEMMGVFWMRKTNTLYGRRTEIVRNNTKIGDIVEVLPMVLR
tara:strand:+ start:6690 stop:7307 length:618 start_codon:yes stop_codon:yes gene_type:complete